jgi:hypothetical protein
MLTQGRRPERTRPTDTAIVQAPVEKKKPERRAPAPKKQPRLAPEPERPAAQEVPPAPPPLPPPPKEEPPASRPVAPAQPPRSELTYEKHILPIVERACVSCHGGKRKRGGLDLRTYTALVRGGDNGTGVVPGKPDDSSLYETVASGRMPPGKNKLPLADRQRIRAWIAQGARSERGR